MNRRLAYLIAAMAGLTLLGAVGANPRYIEELCIGGGHGEPTDGGADFEKNGDLTSNGSVTCSTVTASQGPVNAGVETAVRGVITAWDGVGGNSPGCLRLVAPNGTPYYFFAPDDGTGLRVHTALPTSNSDGQWLKARTITDLSAPPPLGTTTPNTGGFTTLETTGNVSFGTVPGAAYTLSLGNGSALPSTMTVDNWTALSASSGGWGVMGINTYINSSNAAAVKYTHSYLGYAGVGFFTGLLRFYAASGATTADTPLTSVATLDGAGLLTASSFMSTQGAKFGNPTIIGTNAVAAAAKLHVRSGASGFTGTRNWRVPMGVLIETNDDTVLELQGGAAKGTEIWFGDPDSENTGRVRYQHSDDTLQLWTNNVSRFSLDTTGKGTFSGDIAVNGGDITSTANLTISPGGGTLSVPALVSATQMSGTLNLNPAANDPNNYAGVSGSGSLGSSATADSTGSMSGVMAILSLPYAGRTITTGHGLWAQLACWDSNRTGTINTAYIIRAYSNNTAYGRVDHLYGVYIDGVQRGAVSNYALYTNTGAVSFGDDVAIRGSKGLSVGGDVAVNGGDITSTASTLALSPAAGGSVTVNGDLNAAAGKSIKGAFKASSGAAGVSGTIVIPKLTTGGSNGSITVADGIITAFTNPT